MTLEPPTSLTTVIMSPVTFDTGSGSVSVVSSVPVTATMSSVFEIVYVADAGSTVERTLGTSKDKLPRPSVLRTEPGTGADDGHVKAPICIFEAALVTLEVTRVGHEMDIVFICCHDTYFHALAGRNTNF